MSNARIDKAIAALDVAESKTENVPTEVRDLLGQQAIAHALIDIAESLDWMCNTGLPVKDVG